MRMLTCDRNEVQDVARACATVRGAGARSGSDDDAAPEEPEGRPARCHPHMSRTSDPRQGHEGQKEILRKMAVKADFPEISVTW